LEKLGSQKNAYSELGICRALWEPQFYKIQREPKSLLGYILALENLAVLTFPKLHQNLLERYGQEAVHFVRVHAEDDPEHVDEALRQIELCTDQEKESIVRNYEQTCVVYRLMLEEIRKLS
jgi:pyrroloquinoline quinone (PQQ) biosynthesis protein C